MTPIQRQEAEAILYAFGVECYADPRRAIPILRRYVNLHPQLEGQLAAFAIDLMEEAQTHPWDFPL